MVNLLVPTPESLEALARLRSFTHTEWYIIPLLAIILYIYGVEMRKAKENRDYSAIFAGLALLGNDFINEVWNAYVFHFTDYSAFWTTPGDSTFVILIGWNLEIFFMFAIAGIIFCYFLPKEKDAKVFGISNRWFFAIFFSAFCVFVECLLNLAGELVWVYPWWSLSWTGIWLIFFVGYLPFFVTAFKVYDMRDTKRQARYVGILYAVAGIACLAGIALGWI